MLKLTIGDNVRSLEQPNAHVCTIIQINHEYFVLVPMTSRGWPSTNQRNWEYYHIKLFKNLKQADKYPSLFTCQKCDCANKILNAPLRRISAYDNKYQCKRCKKIFHVSKPRGGPGRGQGRKPKLPGEKYQPIPLKLPPNLISWLAKNTNNRNGFIVEAIQEKIENQVGE